MNGDFKIVIERHYFLVTLLSFYPLLYKNYREPMSFDTSSVEPEFIPRLTPFCSPLSLSGEFRRSPPRKTRTASTFNVHVSLGDGATGQGVGSQWFEGRPQLPHFYANDGLEGSRLHWPPRRSFDSGEKECDNGQTDHDDHFAYHDRIHIAMRLEELQLQKWVRH